MTKQRQQAIVHSPPQTRILVAAMGLFCEHGVAGTSLQMIADAIGVTKAAVYHQFKAKENIVLALGALIFDQLGQMADLAEAQPTLAKRRQVFVDQIIALAVEHRDIAGFLHQDPVMLPPEY